MSIKINRCIRELPRRPAGPVTGLLRQSTIAIAVVFLMVSCAEESIEQPPALTGDTLSVAENSNGTDADANEEDLDARVRRDYMDPTDTAGKILDYVNDEAYSDTRRNEAEATFVGRWIRRSGWECAVTRSAVKLRDGRWYFEANVTESDSNVLIWTSDDASSLSRGDDITLHGRIGGVNRIAISVTPSTFSTSTDPG